MTTTSCTRLYGKAAAQICKSLGVKPDRGFASAEVWQDKDAVGIGAFSEKKCVQLAMRKDGKITLSVERSMPQKKPFTVTAREINTVAWPQNARVPVKKFSRIVVDGVGRVKPHRLAVKNEAATRQRLAALARRVTPLIKKYAI